MKCCRSCYRPFLNPNQTESEHLCGWSLCKGYVLGFFKSTPPNPHSHPKSHQVTRDRCLKDWIEIKKKLDKTKPPLGQANKKTTLNYPTTNFEIHHQHPTLPIQFHLLLLCYLMPSLLYAHHLGFETPFRECLLLLENRIGRIVRQDQASWAALDCCE